MVNEITVYSNKDEPTMVVEFFDDCTDVLAIYVHCDAIHDWVPLDLTIKPIDPKWSNDRKKMTTFRNNAVSNAVRIAESQILKFYENKAITDLFEDETAV